MDKSKVDEKKPAPKGAARVPRKQKGSSQPKRTLNAVSTAKVQTIDEVMISEGCGASNLVSPKASNAFDEGMNNEGSGPHLSSKADQERSQDIRSEADESEEEEEHIQKKLKLQELVPPYGVYVIECVCEKLKGGINVIFFKNIGREGMEPFMKSIRTMFGDDVKFVFLIDHTGSRCDPVDHLKLPNRRNITKEEIQKKKFGWAVHLNESVRDPGKWGTHVCNLLNGNKAYMESFDPSRTQGKSPFFDVSQVLFPREESNRRTLDQVMTDEGIVRYLVSKLNLRSWSGRRKIKTEADWARVLEPFFQDTVRGRKAIMEFLEKESGVVSSS